MRRTTAIILGTAALLGVLAIAATPAEPGGGLGSAAAFLVATVKNAASHFHVRTPPNGKPMAAQLVRAR
ncbi:hypothetical protein [Streptomyces chartreusis]